MKLSIVIPAKNEAGALVILLPELKAAYPAAEIIVVNDGSTDNTSAVCSEINVVEVRHQYSMGNGAAVKAGARRASGEVIVFMDGDGQHRAADIPRLLEKIDSGFDMVVGARHRGSQATFARGIANRIYNWLASKMVGHKIEDLTSGFRAMRRKLFMQCLYLLPNGFSYPTTSTMAFFRSGWSVAYIPIIADKREGKSHINPMKDGVRFLLIIFKVATLYSPLKIFFPVAVLLLGTGLSNYLYTYLVGGRFTNMSALMISISLLVFVLGLLSEQITTLLYKDVED